MPSEILPAILGCHQEFLLDMMGRRGAFGLEWQFGMTDDPVDGFRFFDKRDDRHFAAAGGKQKRVYFIHLADHLCPIFGREMILLFMTAAKCPFPLLFVHHGLSAVIR
jgi:hypothetical protein